MVSRMFLASTRRRSGMFRRRLLPLLSISALLATAALYASGALASSVGTGVTLCAKGTSISYSSTGTCKTAEIPVVVAANGDTQALETAVAATLQQQAAQISGLQQQLAQQAATHQAQIVGLQAAMNGGMHS
jgi:hypothetical protein